MLLTSTGDDSASLPIDSLQEQRELISDRQSGMNCDHAPSTASTPKTILTTIEGDRDEASVHISTVDVAPISDCTALRPSAVAQPSHDQNAFLRGIYPPETELDGLYALRQAAKPRTLQPPRASSWRQAAFATRPDTTNDGTSGSYAAPLSPLRERDITALTALFRRDDIYTIEADVNHRLLSLLPEPCWEDDVFEFLKEFL